MEKKHLIKNKKHQTFSRWWFHFGKFSPGDPGELKSNFTHMNFRWIETVSRIFLALLSLKPGHMHQKHFSGQLEYLPYTPRVQAAILVLTFSWRVLRVEQVIARRMSLRINCLAEIRWDFFQNEGLNLKITEKQTEHGFPKVKPDLFFFVPKF